MYRFSCQQGGHFPDCECFSGTAGMESSCEGTESTVEEKQERTVQQIRGWKEGQLLTVWNQQYIQRFGTGVLHLIQINHQPEATIFQTVLFKDPVRTAL
jgi:hypothetical protein